jgi:hypothetical protein
MMSFARKRIDLTFSLGTGTFGNSGANTITVTGLRVRVDAKATGGDAQPTLAMKVFGLPQDMMNQLTTVGLINQGMRNNNSVLVAAGDDGSTLSTVFSGDINQSWADYDEIPTVCLNVMGTAGALANLKPVAALSFQGTADVASIMQRLAQTMGLGFENNGVNAKLQNPYFSGTALAQMRACARAANIYAQIDRGVLAIWQKNGQRGTDVPIVSADNGMVGFPKFSSNGIQVSTLFNPSLRIGQMVQVQSSLLPANGQWEVMQIGHSLDSETPNGHWFSSFMAIPKTW